MHWLLDIEIAVHEQKVIEIVEEYSISLKFLPPWMSFELSPLN